MSFFELVRIISVWAFLAGLAGAAWFIVKNRWDQGQAQSDDEGEECLRENRKGLFNSLGVVLIAFVMVMFAGSISMKEKEKVEAAREAVVAAETARVNAIRHREELASRCRSRLSPREKASIGVCDGQGARGSESLVGSVSCFADLNEQERECREAGY